MAERLVKRWNDWSAGVGYPIDDGQTPGMYNASGLLGLKGELRVAPKKNTVTVGIDESHHYQYFFEEPVASQTPTVDATSSGSGNNLTSGQSVTVSHVVADQPNRVLLVWVFYNASSAAESGTQTFNGDALTLAKSAVFSGTFIGSLYYLINPDVGTHDIVKTLVFDPTGPTFDMVVIAMSLYTANQSAPVRASFSSTGTGTSIAKTEIDSATNEIMVMGSSCHANTTDTKEAAETLIATVLNAGNDMRGTASYKAGSAAGTMTHTLGASNAWVMVGASVAGTSPGPSHLYCQRGGRAGNTPCYLEKVDLFNSAFATLETGNYTLTNLKKCGQPTRYQSFWWLPDGDEFDPRKLTPATGAPSGELAASSAWTAGGADHLGNMNGQMIAGLTANGFAILGVDGTPTTTADWGSYFKVGDKNERPAAISGLSGLSFVLTVEGLFSFNAQARSGLVFEDFRSWRNVFDNIPMPSWRGGLLIPHPTGLLWWVPGELPVNIGIETKSGGMPASGVTELHGGRYMGVHPTGDYVWAIYQPLVSSTNVLILCGYSKTGDPRQLTWQVMGTATLQDAQHLAGIFVSAQSQPLASTYFTPTLFFGDNDDLAYHVLDQRAGPFRSRADTHAVQTSAEAFMSTLEFPDSLTLTRLVVYTSEDRVSGDEWQISLIDQNGEDINVGTPIRSGAVRHERPINRHDISRLTLHVAFTGTSAASRVPPAIKRIELYGDLAVGSA